MDGRTEIDLRILARRPRWDAPLLLAGLLLAVGSAALVAALVPTPPPPPVMGCADLEALDRRCLDALALRLPDPEQYRAWRAQDVGVRVALSEEKLVADARDRHAVDLSDDGLPSRTALPADPDGAAEALVLRGIEQHRASEAWKAAPGPTWRPALPEAPSVVTGALREVDPVFGRPADPDHPNDPKAPKVPRDELRATFEHLGAERDWSAAPPPRSPLPSLDELAVRHQGYDLVAAVTARQHNLWRKEVAAEQVDAAAARYEASMRDELRAREQEAVLAAGWTTTADQLAPRVVPVTFTVAAGLLAAWAWRRRPIEIRATADRLHVGDRSVGWEEVVAPEWRSPDDPGVRLRGGRLSLPGYVLDPLDRGLLEEVTHRSTRPPT